MGERRDSHEPLRFDDEPEVTYEPPAQHDDQRPQARTRGAAWLGGGVAAGAGVAAGGSMLSDVFASLDIFESASAESGVHGTMTSDMNNDLEAPIDFLSDQPANPADSPLDDLIHGAEAEVGGGFILDDLDSFDPDRVLNAGDDLDLASDDLTQTEDPEDDLDFE